MYFRVPLIFYNEHSWIPQEGAYYSYCASNCRISAPSSSRHAAGAIKSAPGPSQRTSAKTLADSLSPNVISMFPAATSLGLVSGRCSRSACARQLRRYASWDESALACACSRMVLVRWAS